MKFWLRKQVYRIFLANMDDMNLRVEEFGNGGDDFIQKPIHEELMKLKIRRQLYIAQLEQENRILQLKLPKWYLLFLLELDKMNKRKKLTKRQK